MPLTSQQIIAELEFSVVGIPQPKGSARAFIPKGWKRAVVTSDNPKNKGWQAIVAQSAQIAIQDKRRRQEPFAPFNTAVRLTVAFYLPRPKAIRDRFVPHTKKPDLDKLVRSVCDALTGVVWRDDSLVMAIDAWKGYTRPGQAPYAEIRIEKACR